MAGQATSCGRWRIGTSGWVYPHWRGIFYPTELPQTRWFQHYIRYFDTVEINNTFYRLPAGGTFDRWREQAPPGFTYAVKASRYITHVRRLRECDEPLNRFLERARRLRESLGPILYQLPPRWRPNLDRLTAFVELLPPDLVHVFEFRDSRWFSGEVLDVLRGRGVSFCIYHMPGLDCPLEVTAPVIYVRMHGAGDLYGGCYDDETLRIWADRIRQWCETGHDVYIYFNNDAFGHAVRNALTLKELLG
ncbi:MAG TPA: DUF72 domain-containing protein [Caldilineae bacterium]|nr:DUF72 domain-containing protein [Caldilineae bacterium]